MISRIIHVNDPPDIEMSDFLSPTEHGDFTRLMHIVKIGIDNFMEAGIALREIRDRRLYREQYKTFEEFCHHKLDRTRGQAGRLVRAMNTIDALEAEVLPSKERVVRELNKVPSIQRNMVWKRALQMSKTPKAPTMGDVRKASIGMVVVKEESGVVNLRAVQRLLDKPLNVPVEDFKECIRLIASLVARLHDLLRKIVSQRE